MEEEEWFGNFGNLDILILPLGVILCETEQ